MKKRVMIVVLVFLSLLAVACGEASKGPKNPFEDIQKGDTITFGKYEGQSISWIVLYAKNGEATLVSKYVLDTMPWTLFPTGSLVQWKDSYIRNNLNSSFYNNSFTTEEKELIISHSYTFEGTKTSDKVGLLSAASLSSLDEYEAKTVTGGASEYWLMENAYFDKMIRVVDKNGNSYKGLKYNELDQELGVRPVIHVRTETDPNIKK